jgi:hypothetical protein
MISIEKHGASEWGLDEKIRGLLHGVSHEKIVLVHKGYNKELDSGTPRPFFRIIGHDVSRSELLAVMQRLVPLGSHIEFAVIEKFVPGMKHECNGHK